MRIFLLGGLPGAIRRGHLLRDRQLPAVGAIEPWDYLRDFLQRLQCLKQSDVPSLLPRCWKPA